MPDVSASPPAEVIVVASRVVACEGGDDVLGHPKVFLRISDDEVTCPYCSRRFRLGSDGGEAH